MRAVNDWRAPQPGAYDGVVLAVAHSQFADLGPAGVRAFGRDRAVVFDVKGILPGARPTSASRAD